MSQINTMGMMLCPQQDTLLTMSAPLPYVTGVPGQIISSQVVTNDAILSVTRTMISNW